MMFFDDPNALRFKARIKANTTVGQDFAWYKWRDENLVFDAVEEGNLFDLSAPGYGILGGDEYGNGSLTVFNLDDLIIDDGADRERILQKKRQEKKAQIEEVTAKLSGLHAEMSKLLEPHP